MLTINSCKIILSKLWNFYILKVKAIHVYEAEDTDELSFEAGEIIGVIPYADPEELV